MESSAAIQLADYRRRVAEIYARVRDAGCSETSWNKWRADRDELFRTHPQSPIPQATRSEFAGLAYFHYDPYYRTEAKVEPVAGQPLPIAHSGDGNTAFLPIGRVLLTGLGIDDTLTLFWLSAYGGGLFLPFTDSTSGTATYGGGRYLLDTVKGADLGSREGRLILDFNFAYHPSCVHSNEWSCPLAPQSNRLMIDIGAGEYLGQER
ncbi:MAG: DUF1684 domain-containing protein [Acidimicrobiia bacterium]|nr:DUF1684 domain-containing protein [Acidimicrobiia bacterium]